MIPGNLNDGKPLIILLSFRLLGNGRGASAVLLPLAFGVVVHAVVGFDLDNLCGSQ